MRRKRITRVIFNDYRANKPDEPQMRGIKMEKIDTILAACMVGVALILAQSINLTPPEGQFLHPTVRQPEILSTTYPAGIFYETTGRIAAPDAKPLTDEEFNARFADNRNNTPAGTVLLASHS